MRMSHQGQLPTQCEAEPRGERGRHFSQSPVGQSERSTPESLGNHHGFEGKNRVAELVPHQGLPWHLCPFPKVGTDGRGSPGGGAEGTTRPHQGTAQPTPQHTALHDGRVKRWSLTWGPHQSWGPIWKGSSMVQQTSVKKNAGGHFPTEPPVEEYARWIEWKRQAVDTPNWWQELEMVLEVDDVQELAQKIWASFKLPWQMSKEHDVENYYQAPPVPHCIC